jgi:hypothetical protein
MEKITESLARKLARIAVEEAKSNQNEWLLCHCYLRHEGHKLRRGK